MVESNVVKLQTSGEWQCLFLPKEKPKDLDIATNKMINGLATFQL